MAFEDHFSGHASEYAKRRPTYPDELFAFLAECAPSRDRVWDCATGSGQAAIALAKYFKAVVATDASAEQVGNAVAAERVEYRVAPAEESGLGAASCDLVTVAQALHWFDFDKFYAEVRRVLKPGGVVAAWCYGLTTVDVSVDAIVHGFYGGELDPFWPEGRRDVENGYKDVPFPFERIDAPEFAMSLEWTAGQMLDYLRTWSSVQRFKAEHDRDPVDAIEAALVAEWGDAARIVRWPLTLLVGRV